MIVHYLIVAIVTTDKENEFAQLTKFVFGTYNYNSIKYCVTYMIAYFYHLWQQHLILISCKQRQQQSVLPSNKNEYITWFTKIASFHRTIIDVTENLNFTDSREKSN